MKAALYIRVSTDDQLEFSPDAQKRALTEYAKKNDYEIDEQYVFIDEGISGTSAKKRPAFMRMIGTAKLKPKPFDAILVHKFDRFARSREDSVVYKSLLRKECGIKVISITEQLEDDKFSVILEAMLEAMAEYYSLNLSDEVMKGMREKALRGGVQCSNPYGYDLKDNKLFINEEEARIVKKAFDMFLSGDTCGEIAKHFNSIGLRNKRGNLFSNRVIKYMIENPVYYGMMRWNYATQKGKGRKINPENEWIIAKGAHEAIVSEEDFNKAQSLIKKYPQTTKPISTEYKHWLGGILRCKECGGTLTFGTTYSYRNDKKYTCQKYSCNNNRKGTCKYSNSISVRKVEKAVIELLEMTYTAINRTGSIESLNISKRGDDNERTLIEKQLEKLSRKRTIAKNAYLNEVDTLEEYKANKKEIHEQEISLKDKLKHIDSGKKDTKIILSNCSSAIEIVKDTDSSIDKKNKALKRFIDKIEFSKKDDTLNLVIYTPNHVTS